MRTTPQNACSHMLLSNCKEAVRTTPRRRDRFSYLPVGVACEVVLTEFLLNQQVVRLLWRTRWRQKVVRIAGFGFGSGAGLRPG